MGNEPKKKEKIPGQLRSSNLFQNKLDEIYMELRKFDDVMGESRDEKGDKPGLRSLSARNGLLVSVAVGLGPPKSDNCTLNNIGPFQVPMDPTPANAGLTENSHSPPPLGPLRPKTRTPLQDISNTDGKVSETKPRKFRIKTRNNTESQTLSKNILSPEPSRKHLLPVASDIPISKRRGVHREVEYVNLSINNSVVWLVPSPVNHYELLELELSWAWEPTVSSRAFRIGESKTF